MFTEEDKEYFAEFKDLTIYSFEELMQKGESFLAKQIVIDSAGLLVVE